MNVLAVMDALADGYLRNEGTDCAYVTCRTETKPDDGTIVGDAWGQLREARATVAELIAALQEIHYFTREARRCEADRVRWLAERAERALRCAGAEPQELRALARAAGGQS